MRARLITLVIAAGLLLMFFPVSAYANNQSTPSGITAVPGGTVDAPTVKVSWSKASGASGYDVDRALWNGSSYGAWSRVKTVSGSTTSLVDAVKAGSRYGYRVRAFHHYLGIAHQSGWNSIYKIIWQRVDGISIKQTSALLTPGQQLQLTAAVNPSNALDQRLQWSSSNTGVAIVSTTGLVTAMANARGETVITAKSKDGSKTATSKIRVGGTYMLQSVPKIYQSDYLVNGFNSWGCLVSCLTMSESYRLKTTFNPITLINEGRFKLDSNNNLQQFAVYWQTGVVNYNSNVVNFGASGYKWIHDQINNGKPVILRVAGPADATHPSGRQHWVVVVGYQGVTVDSSGNFVTAGPSNFLINDPGSRNRTTVSALSSTYSYGPNGLMRTY